MKESTRSELYRDFWSEMVATTKRSTSPLEGLQLKTEKSSGTVCHFQWYDDIKLEGWLHIGERATRVQVALFGDRAAERFDRLLSQKPAIERELGERLIWRDPRDDPEKQRASAVTYFIQTKDQPCEPVDRASWPMIHAWLATRLTGFYSVFAVDSRLPELRGRYLA